MLICTSPCTVLHEGTTYHFRSFWLDDSKKQRILHGSEEGCAHCTIFLPESANLTWDSQNNQLTIL